jgi:hypothetical protein
MKALELLEKSKSTKERAGSYITTIQRNIQKEVIDKLVDKLDSLKDKLFDLNNFTLDTNLNSGLKQMSREDCERNFKEIIEIEYEMYLLNQELKIKQSTFDDYFTEKKVALG